ncbi:MAG TPA: histone deacetylase [Acidimicrobiales bacterium]|nr:histone deacetylase [Acidimicrobiales bacterium]
MQPAIVISSGPTGEAHDTGWGHPERAERLVAVERGVKTIERDGAVERRAGRPATREELLRVHDGAYLDRIEGFISSGGGPVDADTRVSSGSWEAALLAAGSGLEAAERLQAGEADAAFVAVRPPGHHATPDQAMGFCLINNVAVTAAALAERGDKVLIVDWDVHHGNGTQDIFWDDPRVLYVSTHEWPLYPGTGRPDETGGPHARGLTVNVPLPPGATGDVARTALDDLVAPIVERFAPGWVLISAGFDAHRLDPLAGLEWSSGDFSDLAATIIKWAPGPGRTIAFLEGGYDLNALCDSTAATLAALTGLSYRPEPPTSGGPGLNVVSRLVTLREEFEEQV